MVSFPKLTEELRSKRLQHPSEGKPGKVRMVLDTDTYNEIDDQFALAYALLSPDVLDVEAIYAAPFYNDRSSGPGEGMEKSYEEILRLLERLKVKQDGYVFRGSTAYLNEGKPEPSPAALDLIERAMAAPEDDPLYVVAIGAITNVAAAMLIEPEIIRHIVVVWLGGHSPELPHTLEFNLVQDVPAARLMFDSGVPFVQIPCLGVASHLLTTKAELEQTLNGHNAISDFLYERFCEFTTNHFAYGKEIWDVAAIAFLLNKDWMPSRLIRSPKLAGEVQFKVDDHLRIEGDLHFETAPNRHLIRAAWFCQRNPIFRDLFTKLKNFQA